MLEACKLAPLFFNRISRFVEELVTWGSHVNLTAHPDNPDELTFHIIDSLAPLFAVPSRPLFTPGSRVLDLGSGAGFPGLVLAAAIDADFTLVEARRKRASFLSVAAARMELRNVSVRCARASAETIESGLDTVTSRAVGEEGFEVMGRVLRKDASAILWANPEQAINLARAERAGLAYPERYEYEVPRGIESARRVLIVMRKR